MYIKKRFCFRDAAAVVVATAALCEYAIHTACTHHCHTARQFCCSRVWYARVTAQCNVLCQLLYTQYSCAADTGAAAAVIACSSHLRQALLRTAPQPLLLLILLRVLTVNSALLSQPLHSGGYCGDSYT
jgi:hypothetical protein